MRWVFDLDDLLYGPGRTTCDAFDACLRTWTVERGLFISHEYDVRMAELKNAHRTRYAAIALCQGFDLPFDECIGEIVDTMILDRLALARWALPDDIRCLPGEKVVLSNSPEPFAQRMVRLLGLEHVFSSVHGITPEYPDMKPSPAAYDRVDAPDRQLVMVEDTEENLRVPHERGWRTILVSKNPPTGTSPWIHHYVKTVADIRYLSI